MTRQTRALFIFVVVLIMQFFVMPHESHAVEVGKRSALVVAYLYNLAKYSEWPHEVFESEESNFKVCVYNDFRFNEAIKKLSTRQIAGRKVVGRIVENPSELKSCQIAYFSELSHLYDSAQLASASVLTVGEQTGKQMVTFFEEDQTLRFRVNLSQVRSAGIQMSAQLLKLAVVKE